jgi:hypothetical protein
MGLSLSWPRRIAAETGQSPGRGRLEPALAEGHVRLVTSARFLGYAFNPVNFWMVYEDTDAPGLAAAVAEVNNTFGEKHIYVLGDGSSNPFSAAFRRARSSMSPLSTTWRAITVSSSAMCGGEWTYP